MISFWERLWVAKMMMIRDYYKEKERNEKRWENFCQKCIEEITQECSSVVDTIRKAVDNQTGIYVHPDLVNGIIQLPLYSFYLILRTQNGISDYQNRLLKLYFDGFSIPYSKNDFINATKNNNSARKSLLELVGVSDSDVGSFWIQFFKVLYRTDEDTTYIENVISSFCAITMRFAALNNNTEKSIMTLLEQFIKDVHLQAYKCRELPNDSVDFYGDVSFIEHYNEYKNETFKICNYTMDDNDEFLNASQVFISFTAGIIYQVVSKCTRPRRDKEMIIDDIFSLCEFDYGIDGKYIFENMEDYDVENTSMTAAMAHMFTDLSGPNPAGGWIILSRAGGTYNLQTKEKVTALQEAVNFLLGLENYLVDKYPMSGFEKAASRYTTEALRIVKADMDENVTFVD